ncbi:hypothetical protein B0H14DRAFT_3569410 [Mycena olivaceomarginata]|nr:hypothetical protein B0H14DRAFT_3569410 [Mycena olivaceomarginata]
MKPKSKTMAKVARAAPARATTPSTYANTPYPLVLGFHRSSSVGFFFEADTGLSGTKDATVPEDLRLFSDLLDKIRAGWCRIYATGCVSFLFLCFIFMPPSHYPPFLPLPHLISLPSHRRRLRQHHRLRPPSAATSPPSPPAWAPSFYTDNGGFSGQVPLSQTASRLMQLVLQVVNSRTSQPCTPARTPLPVPEIHGGSNMDVPYAGGAREDGTEPGILDCEPLSWRAARNGCTAANTTETPFDADVHHSSWACAEGESMLQHWKVDDMRELLTSSLVSCFVFCLNPTLISYHSTLLPPLLTAFLPLLVPCVSLCPTLPALPIFLRILVPNFSPARRIVGLHFITAFPLFLRPLVFLSSPRLLSPPPISLTRSLFSYSTHPFANATAGPPPRSTPPRSPQIRDPRPSTRARL